MFAVQFERFGPPEVLTLGAAPEPRPGPHQVRVAVRATAVSPVDLALREGSSPRARTSPCRTFPASMLPE